MRLPYLGLLLSLVCIGGLFAAETELRYLSGKGPEDAVDWEFYCTEGRRSREWTKIRVPSCWEQEGFGTYNYGGSLQHGTGDVVGNEQGLYRHRFSVPEAWRGRVVRIVFDGAMTDTTVWINGKQAGPTHQGAFYRFHHDISALVRFGEENLLEVTVSKNSSNRSVNDAERAADYWVFGGLFRPVWLEAFPSRFIDWTAVDAKTDGQFRAELHLGSPSRTPLLVRAQLLDTQGARLGSVFEVAVPVGADKALVTGYLPGARPWSAETPVLYSVRFELLSSDSAEPLHTRTERFGFRTFEVRENDGLYLNGVKIRLKGVNRHCFWPETARTVSRGQSYQDARLIKAANMNAVRMSHYSPDKHFLEACDELGLYVLDELGGWQKPYDKPTGARLIGQLVRRDHNHPSILFWDNGNEGGWNAENDREFSRWDLQARAVLHPWGINSGLNTDHYEAYDSTAKLSAGPQLFMPTEFLHGLYDGGIGAGFRDYWDIMGRSPSVAGGFFWAWCDEGVARSDRDGRVDNAGNQAPDGMVGPHREPEGSYFAVKEIWSPVQLSLPLTKQGELPGDWDGRFEVENLYDFTPLSSCRFEWEGLTKSGQVAPGGSLFIPEVPPHGRGQLKMDPALLDPSFVALRLRCLNPEGRELWTWSMFIEGRNRHPSVKSTSLPVPDHWPVKPGARLVAYRYKEKSMVPVTEGLRLVDLQWTRLEDGGLRCDFRYAVDADVDLLGLSFELEEKSLVEKRWFGRGPYRVYRNRLEGGVLGLHTVSYNDPVPGRDYQYPEFKGYFADWLWLELKTTKGLLTVENHSGIPFLGLCAPRDGEPGMQSFPDTGLALLELIPAMGSKFADPASTGPRGRTPHVSGTRSGSVVFRLQE